MKLGFSQAEEEFRAECAEWLQSQLNGDFADIKGLPGMNSMIERRKDWEELVFTRSSIYIPGIFS